MPCNCPCQSTKWLRHRRCRGTRRFSLDQGEPLGLEGHHKINFEALLIAKIIDLGPTAAIDLQLGDLGRYKPLE